MAYDNSPASAGKKTFVLCFDGTGNKFSGTDSDSNILKIYRMLDRSQKDTLTYYQPGIGTYVTTASLEHTGTIARFKSWYAKAKDSAVGTSFASHVMAGYRFLMRYYSPEDDVYFFGFSRGAYTARFLAEMLDHVGLLSAGNEELMRFAWKAFSRWQSRRGDSDGDRNKAKEMYQYMRNFRETFSRPVRRIRFLGLFDTVNSVPRFESALLERSKFPYTARSSAKVIRHAVSINERRAKFRQDLITGSIPEDEDIVPFHRVDTGFPKIRKEKIKNSQDHAEITADDEPELLPERPEIVRESSFTAPVATQSTENFRPMKQRKYSDHHKTQDILEIWFPGGHADIGGGWKKENLEEWALSHAPLVWMVHEAEKAGLKFNPERLVELSCCPDKIDEYGERDQQHYQNFHHALDFAGSQGVIHDCLVVGKGLPWSTVMSWKMMEYLPFRRMDLNPDGSWKPIRWPLPGGETRDIPSDAKIHVSAIRRMQHDPNYRPGNLIMMGTGGRGMKTAPKKYGMGQWQVAGFAGDEVGEYYIPTAGSIEHSHHHHSHPQT